MKAIIFKYAKRHTFDRNFIDHVQGPQFKVIQISSIKIASELKIVRFPLFFNTLKFEMEWYKYLYFGTYKVNYKRKWNITCN